MVPEESGPIPTRVQYVNRRVGILGRWGLRPAGEHFFSNLGLFDYFMVNDGTKSDLYRKIDAWVEKNCSQGAKNHSQGARFSP